MGLVETPFKLSLEEILCSAAITVILNALSKEGASNNTIEQICFTPQYGFTASASSIPCGPHLVRITDIKEGNINWSTVPYCECESAENYQLYTNDILMARAGSIGKSFIVSDISTEAVFASYMIRLRAKSNFNSKYLYWCLQSQQFWAQIMEAQRGSAMKNINAKMISALTFPMPSLDIQSSIVAFLDSFQIHLKYSQQALPLLPHPLEEQRRIVARIEELAAKIEEARGLRREAVEASKSVLHAARRKLIGDAPSSSWLPLKTFIAEIENGWSPQCENRPATDEEWGVLKLGAVSFGIYDESENKALPLILEPRAEYEVQMGDFLMSRANTTNLVGACVLVEQTRSQLMLSDKIFRFHFKAHPSIKPHYLEHVLKSPALRSQIEGNVSGTSQTMKNISKEKVLNLLIPSHSESEQQSIIDALGDLQSKVDIMKSIQSQTSAELNALLPSILDKAFKGEL